MNYIETSTTWYFERILQSIKWFFFWFFFIILWSGLLWWNEWNSIKTIKWLSEWQTATITWSISPINKDLEWKLVYINWKADTKDILKDSDFFISENAIILNRNVEMFQWEEKEKTQKQSNLWWSQTTVKTYTYNKVWDKNKIDSSNFKEIWHENISEWKYVWDKFISNNVFIWDLKLTNEFVNQMSQNQIIIVSNKSFSRFKLSKKEHDAKLESNYIYLWSWSLSSPNIWDLKISFTASYPSEVSIIWKQQWDQIVSYQTDSETQISLLQYWKKQISEMYQKAFEDNKILTWVLRFVWFILIFVWFNLLFWIIVIIADFIPFLWSIVWNTAGFISFILSIILSFIIIGISWIYFKPIIWIVFLLLAFSSVFLFKFLKNKKTLVDNN